MLDSILFCFNLRNMLVVTLIFLIMCTCCVLKMSEKNSLNNTLFMLCPFSPVTETPASVYKALKTFGYSTFRPGQESAVMRILCGE